MKKEVIKQFNYDLAKKIFNKEINGKIFKESLPNDIEILSMDLSSTVNPEYPILVHIKENDDIVRYNKEGNELTNKYDSLKIKISESFKEGDIIVYSLREDIGIVSKYSENTKSLSLYFSFSPSNKKFWNGFTLTNTEDNIRLATEEEKREILTVIACTKDEIFYDLMKNIGYNDIESYKIPTGTPVLGKDGGGEWRYDIFSNIYFRQNSIYYRCVGRSYSIILPYEGNENLLDND